MIGASTSGSQFSLLRYSSELRFCAHASYAELCRRLKICATPAELERELNFRYRYLSRDETLYSSNEKLQKLFVVSTGCLKAETYQNQKLAVSRFLMSGDIAGIEAIYNGIHNWSVVSLTNSAVIEIPYGTFKTLCRASDDFNHAFVRYFSKSISSKRDHVRTLANANAQTRVARFLIWLSEKTEDSGRCKQILTIHMSRAEIAAYLGLTSESVCRMLGRLRDLRYIGVAGNRIEIKDYFSLGRLAKRVSQRRTPVAQYNNPV